MLRVSPQDGMAISKTEVASVNQFEPVVGATRTVIWEWDFETDLVKYLGDVHEMLGAEFRNGQHFIDLIWSEDRARVLASFHRTRAEGRSAREEFRICRQDGSILWVAEIAVIRLRLDGTAAGMKGSLVDITGHRHAEHASRQQAAVVRQITESAAEAIFLLDQAGRVTFINPEAERTFGYCMDELLGQALHEVIHQHRAEAEGGRVCNCLLGHALLSGKPLRSHPDRFFRKDGSLLEVMCSSAPIVLDGEVSGVVVRVNNVTAEKHTLASLQEREERYRSLASILTSVVWTADPHGAFVSPQPEWEAFTGQSLLEYQGFGWTEMLHPADRLQILDAWKVALEHRTQHVVSGRIWHAVSASYRYFATRAIPLLNPDGSVREWIGTITDIHDQRQAEEETRKNREQFTAIFEQAFVGICQVDLTGRYVLANRRFCEIVGRPLEELLKLRMQDITHPDDLPRDLPLFANATAGGNGYEHQKRYVRPDGSVVWVRLQVAVIRDGSGEPESLAAVCEDITARRKAEEQHDQLIQRERAAREEAERANRAKDEFLAALSHELRTPLTPVLMTAAARASDSEVSQELREEFSMIRRNVELEARLIDDLLDLTRIARGKLALLTTTVDLHALLAQTAEIVKADAEAKGVWLTFDLEAPDCFVVGDIARLQQVVWNLLKNAIKFTPTDGEITLRTSNPAPGQVEITIRDSGIGIAPEVLPHIFEAFEQGEAAGQHRFGGLGLGLAITKAIVELHGGTISAHSGGRECGATFLVRLNTVVPPEQVDGVTRTVSGERAAPLRLLVVEDHAPTLAVLTRLLEKRGHAVEPAGTVHGALALANAQQFDLVISDIGLPDGSGIDLMRELSTRHRLMGIALSGYGMEEDLVRTREAGFRAHLVKPISFERLDEVLEPFMRRAVE